MERRNVRLVRPRRVLASLRYRSFKTQQDRDIWEACLAPVERLRDEGWRLSVVTVDWGRALPNTDAWRVKTIRDLLGCYDGCEVREAAADAKDPTGRGYVDAELVRDERRVA